MTIVSPVKGGVSSEYGRRGSGIHLGMDIATNRKPGDVFAAFAGTIVEIVRGVKAGSRVTSSPWAPGRTPNLIIIQNPDGEFQLYGHVSVDARWKIGDKVGQGDYLGRTDLSGNTTGYHVHFEIWNKRKVTRNPRIDFRYFNVTPGSEPKGVNKNPWGTPTKPPAGTPAPKGPSSTVKSRLKRMGLPQSIAGVIAYQKAHGLFPDGDWGGVTDRFWNSVVARQKYINTWKRVSPKLFVDGFWGAKSVRGESQAKAGAIPSVPYRPPAFAPKR